MAVHYSFNDPAAESAHRVKKMQQARQAAAAPPAPPPAAPQAASDPWSIVPVPEMVESLVADGWTPDEAAKIAASDVRVTGGTPRALHEQNQSPEIQAARRRRVQDQRAAEARQGRFEADYNAATGAPGWGYDAAGNAVKDPAPAAQQSSFGQTREHPILAARRARGEETQARFDEQIAADKQADADAKRQGYRNKYHKQSVLWNKSVDSSPAATQRARGQWERDMVKRYKAVADPDMIEKIYEEHSKDANGNQRTHSETVKAIAASGALQRLRTRQGMAGAKGTQQERDDAVAANAKQHNEAMKMRGPQGRAMLANTMIGAQNPFDLARAAAGAHALDPNAGWGNLAMGMGAEAANAEAVAGMGGQRQGPVAKLDADRALVQQKPLGQRAQGYRDMHRGLNAGQPMNPEQENLFLVTEGTGDASAAAGAVLGGTGGEDEMAFLREYTNAFVAGGAGTDRTAFEQWSRRLGIPVTQESMQLWKDLTGTNVRTYSEYWGVSDVPSSRPPTPAR